MNALLAKRFQNTDVQNSTRSTAAERYSKDARICIRFHYDLLFNVRFWNEIENWLLISDIQ
jgi:hypothetical protein